MLSAACSGREALLRAVDHEGMTPLMRAVRLRDGGEMTGLLLDAGADCTATWKNAFESDYGVLALALNAGDPAVVARLLDAGADPAYDRGGYDALLDAVRGRDLVDDPLLIPLLSLLIARGVRLDTVTRWQESGLRVLARVGRYDAVARLLDAGADAAQLGWTPLHRAVALGDAAAVRARLAAGDALEARCFWSRTPWLVAVVRGDLTIIDLLRRHGAGTDAAARGGQRALALAATLGHVAVLEDLVGHGAAVDTADEHGNTALLAAAEHGRLDAVRVLVAAGARLEFPRAPPAAGYPPELARALQQAADDGSMTGALEHTTDPAVARWLLDAGADPQQLDGAVRRALLGLHADQDLRQLRVDPESYARARSPRFGRANPERIDEPFWQAMIRAGCDAYTARQHFDDGVCGGADPVWCARRFGQSISFLDDGRIVQVGGEHEDSYDPDFYIYNDVFVHSPDGEITIYGYPKHVFPPTDFHSATVAGTRIILIGGLGYPGERRYRTTPVYALDLERFRITRVECNGEPPGWIYSHRAERIDEYRIEVHGGTLLQWDSGTERTTPLRDRYVLDLRTRAWSRQARSR